MGAEGPAIVQDLLGALDKDGRVVAWRHHMWVPTINDTHLIATALIGKPDITGATGTGEIRLSNTSIHSTTPMSPCTT